MARVRKTTNGKTESKIVKMPEMKDFPSIRVGDSGGYVTAAQANLQARGYNIGKNGVNGKFGLDLLKAVKAFQKDIGNPIQNGIVGPKTWEAMQTSPLIKAKPEEKTSTKSPKKVKTSPDPVVEEKVRAEVNVQAEAKPAGKGPTDYRIVIEHLTRYQAEMLIHLFEGGIQCHVI